jgi:hypothetical protein
VAGNGVNWPLNHVSFWNASAEFSVMWVCKRNEALGMGSGEVKLVDDNIP